MHILQGDLVTFIHVLLPISCKNKAEHLNTRLAFAKIQVFYEFDFNPCHSTPGHRINSELFSLGKHYSEGAQLRISLKQGLFLGNQILKLMDTKLQ